MGSRVIFFLFLVSISLVVWRPGASVFVAGASYTLYGSSTFPGGGWGFTEETMSRPGPDITARQGEIVQLSLTAVVEYQNPPYTFPHDFSVDYDGDGNPEIQSPVFGGGEPDTITYIFTADGAPNTYRYYCSFHPGIMFGSLIITQPGTPPTASFSYVPATPAVGQAVTFDASGSSDPEGAILSYEWLFGDGGSGIGVTPEHVYTNLGTYPVVLTVTDDTGLMDSTSQSIVVTGTGNSAPTAIFDFTPSAPILGQSVDFDASASLDPDPGDYVSSFSWDFGDGTTLNSQTQPLATHVYRSFGSLQISLTVTDSHGASSQRVEPVNVLPIRNVAVTSLAVTPPSVKSGTEVTIDTTILNQGNVTEVFQIQLMWNSTKIVSWPATVSATEGVEKSYNWTAPGSGTYIILAKVLVSSDDQNLQDNEKTVSLTVEAQDERAPGLSGVVYWSLAGVAAAMVGATVYVYTKRRGKAPLP